MFGEPGRKTPERIAFFLVPDFSMIAFSSAVEPLRIANRMAGRKLYAWRIVSKDGKPVRASCGVAVIADARITPFANGARLPFSSVLVCSGIGAEHYEDREVFSWLRSIARKGVDIGAICTGSHILARAGLLAGYRCTIHWENLSGFAEAFPDVDVAAHLFAIDRNRFTCSGGTAGLDMMLHLISQQHGEELAAKVSEQCLLDQIRRSHSSQRMPLNVRLGGHHPKLIATIGMMEANLEEPLSPEELAAHVGLSRRQLERLFRKHLGRSPAQYYLELRLERARHLLYQTNMAVLDVALASGFVSASHFSKCYRQMYGKTPRAERIAAIA
ncbi:MAG: GlxA family transcriptional regulator [Rhodospirillaceae bacterium]|jgi:AraC family transcriptional regulator, glycine betaine-responsive activator|nr:GlxA family transcriptional regulator [Rhodospirillaceae bacterium]MBT6116642.1 GlxA family transcriptional regulator [Rhodospirillaceae bacterium]